jgi:hypothetical protein
MQGSPATVRCVEEMAVLCGTISRYAVGLWNQTAQFRDLWEKLFCLKTGGLMTLLLLCVKFNFIGNQ